MTMTHNFLVGTGTKPTVAETTAHEIVINEADGSLWSKSTAGVVLKVGGSDTDLSAYTTTVDIDADNATQDTAIAGKANTVHAHVITDVADLQLALDAKEDSVTYGAVDYMAVVNATADGFDFIAQPDFEFYRLRGTIIPHAGSVVDAFADTVGDNAVSELVAGLAPAVGSDPSGVTYRCETDIPNVIIHPGDGAVSITVGDLVFWSGDSSKWLHLPVENTEGVSSVNLLEGDVDIVAGDGIVVTNDTSIHVAVDADVSRDGHTHLTADVTDLQAKLDAKAEDVHTHVIGDVTDLQAQLDLKAPAVHTHVEADITDLDKYTTAQVDAIVTGVALTGEPT